MLAYTLPQVPVRLYLGNRCAYQLEPGAYPNAFFDANTGKGGLQHKLLELGGEKSRCTGSQELYGWHMNQNYILSDFKWEVLFVARAMAIVIGG